MGGFLLYGGAGMFAEHGENTQGDVNGFYNSGGGTGAGAGLVGHVFPVLAQISGRATMFPALPDATGGESAGDFFSFI